MPFLGAGWWESRRPRIVHTGGGGVRLFSVLDAHGGTWFRTPCRNCRRSRPRVSAAAPRGCIFRNLVYSAASPSQALFPIPLNYDSPLCVFCFWNGWGRQKGWLTWLSPNQGICIGWAAGKLQRVGWGAVSVKLRRGTGRCVVWRAASAGFSARNASARAARRGSCC